MNNIYPIFNKIQQRIDKEKMLGQHGITIWFTGLSGSGKSTSAIALEQLLASKAMCAGFWMGTISGPDLILTLDFQRKTEMRTSGELQRSASCSLIRE